MGVGSAGGRGGVRAACLPWKPFIGGGRGVDGGARPQRLAYRRVGRGGMARCLLALTGRQRRPSPSRQGGRGPAYICPRAPPLSELGGGGAAVVRVPAAAATHPPAVAPLGRAAAADRRHEPCAQRGAPPFFLGHPAVWLAPTGAQRAAAHGSTVGGGWGGKPSTKWEGGRRPPCTGANQPAKHGSSDAFTTPCPRPAPTPTSPRLSPLPTALVPIDAGRDPLRLGK